MAVLLKEPVAEAGTLVATVSVTLPPAGRLTVSLMLPLPGAVQLPPPAATQVQVPVSTAGKVSTTVAPAAASGPALLAVTV